MTYVALMIFPALMAVAAASDLLTLSIPNRLTIAVGAVFLVLGAFAGLGWMAFAWHFGVGVLVLAVGIVCFAQGWIGGGDAKLAAGIALWMGPTQACLQFLVVSGLVGGGLGLLLLAMRRFPPPAFALGWRWLDALYDTKNGVPYGIALAAGALTAYTHSPVWRALAAGG